VIMDSADACGRRRDAWTDLFLSQFMPHM